MSLGLDMMSRAGDERFTLLRLGGTMPLMGNVGIRETGVTFDGEEGTNFLWWLGRA